MTETKENKNVKDAEVVETPKKESKKIEVKQENKTREFAEANLYSAQISTKHSIAICRMIKNKSIERAIQMLELVLQKKLAVPMIGAEIPHRKRSLIPHTSGGSGRFPMNATKEFLGLVKQLKANCEYASIDNPVITIGMSNLGSRPFRRDGKKGKRTHVHLEARDRNKLLAMAKKK